LMCAHRPRERERRQFRSRREKFFSFPIIGR
jgi:hypothetical protein